MKNIHLKIILVTTFLGAILFTSGPIFGTEYKMKSGKGSFSVSAPAKTIFGESKQVSVHIDSKSGKLDLEVAVNSFQFTNNFVSETMNEMIYERFNNYYLESNRYPKVTYNAQITNKASIDFEKDGIYPIKTKGLLTIHGVNQEVSAQGIVTVKNKKVSVSAKIVVLPSLYKIRIPPYIGNMYFKEVFIEVNGALTN